MKALKLLIVVAALALTAVFATWDASALSCHGGCNAHFYDAGRMGHGHLEVLNAGPVHYGGWYGGNGAQYITGLRPGHRIQVAKPQYRVPSPHWVYPSYGYDYSRYGHSIYYGARYSGYSGSYGSAGLYRGYGNGFVY